MATEREVRIKLSAVAAPGAGGDPFKAMAQQAKTVDTSIKGMGKSWQDTAKSIATSAGSLDNFSKTLAKIKQNDAFTKLSGDILKSSKSLDDFNAKMIRAEQRLKQNAAAAKNFTSVQGGGGLSWDKKGNAIESGAGGLFAAGGRFGAAGIAAAGGGLLMRDAATLFGLQSAGAGMYDLKKGEGGTILNMIAGVKDSLSGRDFRDRRDAEAAEKATQRIQMEHALRLNSAGIQDARAGIGRFSSESDPLKRATLQRQNLGVQLGAVENRLREGANEFGALGRDVGGMEAARATNVADVQRRRAAFDRMVEASKGGKFTRLSREEIDVKTARFDKEMIVAQERGLQSEAQAREKLLSLTRLQLGDEEKRRDLMKEQARLVEQVAAGKHAELQGQKLGFANLDPMEREEAIRLRSKLTAGEQLSGEEERLAAGFGVLDKDLQKRQLENLNKGPEWMRFVQAGPDKDLAQQATQALKLGNLNIELKFDEDRLLDLFNKQFGPVFDRIKILGEQVITLEQKVANDKAKLEAGRNRLFNP